LNVGVSLISVSHGDRQLRRARSTMWQVLWCKYGAGTYIL